MPQSTKLKALVWAAVSTIDQAEDDKFSLDAQIADSRAIAEKNDWHIIDEIRIEGHSRNYRTLDKLAAEARKNGEQGFDRLIQHLGTCDFDILVCRDANRFARKASLLYEIVDTILEDCKARIYSLSDGMVDESNADMWLMVKGYEIRKQMNWISKELLRGRQKLVDDKGLPAGSSVVWSHYIVRDANHKAVALVPDPAKRLIIEDAARVVLTRISWLKVEVELFKQFGHGKNGRPFAPYFFYHLFYNPWFWGDAARNFKNPDVPNRQRKGIWIIDPSVPMPEGVVIHRAVNPPALDGELALKLKAELIRRMTFRPKSHNQTYPFSGLLVCQQCGFTMVHDDHHRAESYKCQSKYFARSRPGCTRTSSIRSSDVQAWLSAALTHMLETDEALYFIDDTRPETDLLAQLDDQYGKLQEQIRRLIDKQAAAPANLEAFYEDSLRALSAELQIVDARIAELSREAQRNNPVSIQQAFNELSAYGTVENFWQADSGLINQLLHRLLGKRRLVVSNRQIVGVVSI